MKNKTGILNLRAGTRRFLLAAGLALVSISQSLYAAKEVTVPLLRVGPDYFTNATLSPQSSTHVTVLHSRGMTMAKAADLDPDLQRQLGFDLDHTKSATANKSRADQSAEAKQTNPDAKQTNTVAMLRGLLEAGKQKAQEEAEDAQVNDRFQQLTPVERMIGWGILIVMVVGYYFFSTACYQLCRRAGHPSTILVWLPIWKRLALFRATGTSWWWFFLGIFVPFLGFFFGFIGWLLCCLRLCETFQRTRWWALLMIFPFLDWLVIMYFAHASRHEDNEPALRDMNSGYAF